MNILFAAPPLWPQYEAPLKEALKDLGLEGADIILESADPTAVDYILYAPSSPLQDFSPYKNAKAVLSLWAGVERIVGNQSLTQPLCRLVDESLAEGMVEWCLGHVLRHHLGMDAHICNPEHLWHPKAPPLAKERRIGILGLGELGQAVGQALRGVNFAVSGWSRSAKEISGIECFSGAEGLEQILAQSEILITLLPRTPATESIINDKTLALLPKGAVILNPGRGALIDEAALIRALDNGQISHATLDVFWVEPLPQDHAFWDHPKVTVTPHIAAATRAKTAARVLAENIRRGEAGEPFLYLVDHARGY